MAIHRKSNFQLRTDTICTGYEYRLLIFILIQAEQGTEAAQISHDLGTERSLDVLLHSFDSLITSCYVDTSLLVSIGH
ncbi:hypothetical protein D3C85_1826720 [compost metagenome]